MEVAILEHHRVPVLTLQHVVIPIEKGSSQNAHLIISGATDGSIAVWDITNLVITFTKQNSVAVSAGTQLRPRTGRGSQGGRRFRSAKQRLPKEMRKKVDIIATVDSIVDADGTIEPSSEAAVQVDDAPYQSSVLLPLHTFEAAHQSGVNCLSAARYRDSEVVVVSGGDDQRLHVEIFKIHSCEPASGDLTEGSLLLLPKLISIEEFDTTTSCKVTQSYHLHVSTQHNDNGLIIIPLHRFQSFNLLIYISNT